MASTRTRSRVSAPRRKLVWARTFVAGTLSNAGGVDDTAYVNLLGQFETAYGADLLGVTIMRHRGLISWFQPAPAQTTPNIAQLIYGARIATQESSAPPAPLTELPDTAGPRTSPHADWMAFQPISSIYTGDGTGVIDVRSMRRLDEMQQYFLGAFQLGSSMGAGIQISFNATFSTLIALP